MLEAISGEVMHDVVLQRALRWLEEAVREHPEARRAALVNEVSLRFDLTPAEEEVLLTRWANPD
jgi:hypothetical protein